MTRILTPEHKRALQEGRKATLEHKNRSKTAQHAPIAMPTAPRAVQSRLSQIPARFKPQYKRAMSGRSMRAAVNAQCAECMGWEGLPDTVRYCTAPACPLHPYRPYRDSPGARAADERTEP
jgi:hypothetical protein